MALFVRILREQAHILPFPLFRALAGATEREEEERGSGKEDCERARAGEQAKRRRGELFAKIRRLENATNGPFWVVVVVVVVARCTFWLSQRQSASAKAALYAGESSQHFPFL